MDIQSELFGFNHTISVEFSTCDHHNKYLNYVSNEENLNIGLK